ncbi:helix-turn-helix transcriptional regulator [Paenibacillus donghaensis]|uniref:Uncharacterized protein n=1 Tax=Paenibacillus donghaensis TaxID=414771 RepID=A0A2Z2KLG1_9BACL|nr:WYL domain-containing protein [Paenibacillus donghaensis]ASA19448.1 hypothetical protein B9T62_00405 [Paenibacillus donghaensis]
MSHMHRIQWFDQQIKAGRYPNSNHLAEQFEISKRQAQRDIEYLASSLRAPLQYVAKQRGYCYEDDSFMLPHLYITDEEKQILKYLAYRYSHYNYENGPAVRRIGKLLERFTNQEELEIAGGHLPLFEVNAHALQMIGLLEQAIRDQLMVRIFNKDQAGELELCPLKLESHYDEDYLLARTSGQDHVQSFPLSDIQRLQLTERQFHMERESVPQPIGARKLKPFTALIRLAAPPDGAYWYGFPIRNTRDDLYEVSFVDPETFLQQLLTTQWQQLLAPRWLMDRLNSRCQAMLKRLHPQEDNDDTQ